MGNYGNGNSEKDNSENDNLKNDTSEKEKRVMINLKKKPLEKDKYKKRETGKGRVRKMEN